jgi:hypothetical protein
MLPASYGLHNRGQSAARSRSKLPSNPVQSSHRYRSEVFVDFVVADSLLQVVICNLGNWPAQIIRVEFEPRILDCDGLALADNPLFTRLDFLAPQRSWTTLMDTWSGYAGRCQPTELKVNISWQDFEDAQVPAHRRRTRRIRHDLNALAGIKSLTHAAFQGDSGGSVQK